LNAGAALYWFVRSDLPVHSRTIFYLTKKLLEVVHINDMGRTVRCPLDH
jgi:hypothetical protein